jgi:hypothetical protein
MFSSPGSMTRLTGSCILVPIEEQRNAVLSDVSFAKANAILNYIKRCMNMGIARFGSWMAQFGPKTRDFQK